MHFGEIILGSGKGEGVRVGDRHSWRVTMETFGSQFSTTKEATISVVSAPEAEKMQKETKSVIILLSH